IHIHTYLTLYITFGLSRRKKYKLINIIVQCSDFRKTSECINLFIKQASTIKVHKMSIQLPADISSYDRTTFKAWINSFDVVLCDCDGVLWLHNDIYEGASDVVNKLTDLGKKVYLITNNNMASRQEMREKCQANNFKLEIENMISSAFAMGQYMKHIKFNKKVYVIGSNVLANELESVGLTVIGRGPDVAIDSLPDQVKNDLGQMDDEVGAVVVGFDHHYSFPKLFKAVNYLRNENVKFLATNTDESIDFPFFTFPDAGAIVAGIKNITKIDPIVIGKPSKILSDVTLKDEAHREPKRFLVVGDRLNTDIMYGNNNNYQTILVGTGVHNMTDVQQIIDKINNGKDSTEDTKKLIPDFYISSMKELKIKLESI
ncbi:CLUMA_CG005711, isoform A, partial [Clunio marinus]